MLELAEKLYDLASDMDATDYEETKDADISAIIADLENMPEDGALFRCLEMIAAKF